MAAPRLGIALPAGTGGEVAAYLEAVNAAAERCEAAGVELLVLDGRPAQAAAGSWCRLDPYAVLGAVSAETSLLRLAALVPADERAPSLAAKATSTLDVCSLGRAVLVLATPSVAPTPEERLEVLGECVQVAGAMLAEPAPDIVGRHVAVHGAWNEPRSAVAPPPVGVLLAGASRTGAIDRWPTPPAFVLVEEAGGGPFAEERPPAYREGPRVALLVRLGAGGSSVLPSPRPGGRQGLVAALDDPLAVTSGLLGRLAQQWPPTGG